MLGEVEVIFAVWKVADVMYLKDELMLWLGRYKNREDRRIAAKCMIGYYYSLAASGIDLDAIAVLMHIEKALAGEITKEQVLGWWENLVTPDRDYLQEAIDKDTEEFLEGIRKKWESRMISWRIG